jgi:hypothetical protein
VSFAGQSSALPNGTQLNNVFKLLTYKHNMLAMLLMALMVSHEGVHEYATCCPYVQQAGLPRITTKTAL